MIKQVQEAYIVAATRTPIGRSHRGYFRNTRPDDLLATALRAALAQMPKTQERIAHMLKTGKPLRN
jgi:acetyl-CoA acyltransferase